MATELIDLHIHTTASDGSFTPRNIIERAAKNKLRAIAITDHDTIEGLEEAQIAAKEYNIECVRGCELSTRLDTYDIHIVGLWIPQNPQKLINFHEALKIFQNRRTHRNVKIIQRLQNIGIDITMEDVQEISGGSIIGRPHFAMSLIQKKIVKTEKEAFNNYLGKDKKAYIPRDAVTPHEAIRILKEINASIVLAHPGLIKCSPHDLENIVHSLIPHGLTAIEAYHSSHNSKDERNAVALAKKCGLLLSGGSDFHGKSKPAVELGKGKGSLRVPYQVLENLKKDRIQRGLEI